MTPLRLDYPISVAILYFEGTASDMIDTLQCVKGIQEALEENGHMVRTVAVNKKNWRQAVRTPGEVVFNLVEDYGYSLYNKVGERLEEMGRAQFGHDLDTFNYVTKKARIKRKLSRLKIPTPSFKIYNRRSPISDIRVLEYPVIVKPSGEHAGVGISQDSVVIDHDELRDRVKYLFKEFPGEVVAEEYIEGREIHVTVIGNGRHIIALPFTEIEFGGEFTDNWNVYTYNAKWEQKTWEYWGARISQASKMSRKLREKIEKICLKAYKSLNCRDIARFDLRVDDKDKPYIVDINLNPSLNRYDDQDATLMSTQSIGWSYEEFIETLVAISYKRVYGKLPDRMRERSFMLTAPLK